MDRIRSSAAAAAAMLALVAAGAALSGCVVAAAGGGVAAGYAVLGEDLSPAQQMADYAIKANVEAAWGGFSQEMAHRLSATVFDGEVLITGRVPNRQWRSEAARLARGIGGVRLIHDQVEVGPDTHFIDEARDTWITTQLRSELVADIDIKSINYTITTSDRVVYIMGFARTRPELDRVIEHARTVAGVRRVVPFIRVLSAADLNGPPPAAGEDMNGPPPGDDEDLNPPPEDENTGRGAAPAPPPRSGGTIKAEPLGPQ